ncbi:CaiF/GrlA family transcriptional regulator, partial [Escherichia coli]|nr:CaiF/GrlA family transcriptional regulator [Escherichia coli]
MAGEIFTSIHNNYRHRIPAGVSDLVEQPLYIIVATWAMRTNTLLTTEEVSREFLLTQQRATDIIHYIHNEGSKHITSERITLIKNTPKRTRYRALKIINVTPLPKQLL